MNPEGVFFVKTFLTVGEGLHLPEKLGVVSSKRCGLVLGVCWVECSTLCFII